MTLRGHHRHGSELDKHGCYDRAPYKDWYFVQDGWFIDGVTRVYKLTKVEHVMTRDCQFTIEKPTHPRCEGCKWQKCADVRNEGEKK